MATLGASTEYYPAAMATVWCRGRNLFVLPLQTTNDYSEIGRLSEDEIRMSAVTGVLFKWPLIRQIRGRGYGTGMEAMSDKRAPPSP
jgi:hypothetical protein